jgi:hypothetical protein
LYLGGHLSLVELDNGVMAWAFRSAQCVRAAAQNVEDYIAKDETKRWKLLNKAETPLCTSYRPELDVTPELSPQEAANYQSLIGILRWIVELGRVDVCLEVSMMSSHLVLPSEGLLEQVFHIFAHLKKYHNTEVANDPNDPVIDEAQLDVKDWVSSELGPLDGVEELPPSMPEPRGQGIVIRAEVDADHASDSVTGRSRIGFLLWINSCLVLLFE